MRGCSLQVRLTLLTQQEAVVHLRSLLYIIAGGSLSNMYGMVLARHRLEPDIKSKGLYCLKTLVAFTSEDVSIVILYF